MMIDHHHRNAQGPNGIGQNSKPPHIADINDNQRVHVPERVGSSVAGLLDTFEEKSEHAGPRRRVDNPRANTALPEKARERALRSTAITISVDVSRDRDCARRRERAAKLLNGRYTRGRNGKEISHFALPGPSVSSTAP